MTNLAPVAAVYQRFLRTPFGPPTEEQVARLEQTMGTRLPSLYREFLLKYNGGYFNDPLFRPEVEECEQDGLDVLWGVNTPQRETDLEYKLDTFDDNSPAILLPIGYTPIGNLLLMPVGGDDAGQIELKLAYRWTFVFVADNIVEFLKMLR